MFTIAFFIDPSSNFNWQKRESKSRYICIYIYIYIALKLHYFSLLQLLNDVYLQERVESKSQNNNENGSMS